MEITSIVGPVMGFATILLTAYLKHLPFGSLITAAGLTIVFLGTISALLIAYQLKDVITSLKSVGLFLNGPNNDSEGLISAIERLAAIARKDGFLAVEKEIEKLEDPFLKKGIQMLVDNTEPGVIKEVLEAEIDLAFEEEEIAVKFWEDMGAFSPTVGIIGAVLGLMFVMQNLQNPDMIGPGIAAAFTATIYGVALANLWALPCAKKVKRMLQEKKLFREIASTGVLGIANSTNPKILVARLRGMAGEEHHE